VCTSPLLVWNLEKGDVEYRLIGHTGPVTAVSVTADGTIAVSGARAFLRSINVFSTACVACK